MSDWIFEPETEYHRNRWVWQGWGNGYVWLSDLNEIKPYFWQVDVEYGGHQNMMHGYADTPELAMAAAQDELSRMTETANDYYAAQPLEADPADDPQGTFPGWQTLVTCSRHGLGVAGERIASAALINAGYEVTTLQRGGTDLRAKNPLTGELFKVEVKTARRSKDKKWRFALQTQRTSHLKSDVVMLQQILDSGAVYTYVIPAQDLGNRKLITVPSANYSGKWAAYRQSSTPRLEAVI
jgi:hypothetical protein